MARLPISGSDSGVWGDVLNDYLQVSLTADGLLKPASVGPSSLQDDSVSETKLTTTGGSNGNVLAKNTGVTGGLEWVAGSSAPDATVLSKGIVQLAGDLAGTAALPTVPGLAAKADDTSVVHDTGAETIAGVKTFSSSPEVPVPTTSVQAVSKGYVDGLAKVRHTAPIYVTSGTGTGDVIASNGGTWQEYSPVGEITIDAAVGDFIMVTTSFLIFPGSTTFYDLAIKKSSSLVYFAGSGTSTPLGTGDPALYPDTSFMGVNGGQFAVVATPSLIEADGKVHVVLVVNSTGGGKLYYSSLFPYRWHITSHVA